MKNRTRHGIIKKNCTHQIPNGIINERMPATIVITESPKMHIVLK
jgi:hypothetical protein